MKHKTKRQKIVWLAVAALIAIIVGALVYLKINHTPSITDYSDKNGGFYKCERPIKAKLNNAYASSLASKYEPADYSEAAKYCKLYGIE